MVKFDITKIIILLVLYIYNVLVSYWLVYGHITFFNDFYISTSSNWGDVLFEIS